jgi:hypothetical protein
LNVAGYGGRGRVVEVVTGTGHWSKAGEGLVPVRWGYVHDRTGTHRDEYFYSTDVTMTAQEIIEGYTGRWNSEHGLRVSKSEIGFRHFEGRSYVALLRHLTLCCVTLTFVAGRAAELRGEKPRGDRGASLPRAELGVRPVAGAAARDEPLAIHGRSHRLPPAA